MGGIHSSPLGRPPAMFNRKTVFVIGAGCSREYGLPMGAGLKEVIIDYLQGAINRRKPSRHSGAIYVGAQRGDSQFADAFDVLCGRNWNEYRRVLEQMIDGIDHASSIDRYLDFNRDDPRIVEIGKLAITRAILAAEGRSSLGLRKSGSLDTPAIRKTAGKESPTGAQVHWLGELFSRLTDGGVERASPAAAFSNVSFICFNYDRCIEHYLMHALRAFGRYEPEEAAAALAALKIVHPYGQVGRLEWQSGQQPIAPFGADISSASELIELSRGIRLFTEQADSKTVADAHSMLLGASQIVFMGYSFLKQNMDLLKLPAISPASLVLGTCFRESNQNVSVAKDLITASLSGPARERWGGHIDLPNSDDMTAGGFLSAYGNMLRG